MLKGHKIGTQRSPLVDVSWAVVAISKQWTANMILRESLQMAMHVIA
jgi:hypothetical protein